MREHRAETTLVARCDELLGGDRVDRRATPLPRALGEDLGAFAPHLLRVVECLEVAAGHRDVRAEEHSGPFGLRVAVWLSDCQSRRRYTQQHD